MRSLQVPASFIGPTAGAANANARLSAQINSMLCVSRFAHYVKMMGRHMVGSFKTAEEIEARLQSWLTSYVNTSPTAGPEMRARYPLVNARLTVRERPGARASMAALSTCNRITNSMTCRRPFASYRHIRAGRYSMRG